MNAPDITTTKGLRDHAIIAVLLLSRALRRPDLAALTDGRSAGGFTSEATVAARHANTSETPAATHRPCKPWTRVPSASRASPSARSLVAATHSALAGAGTGRRASSYAKPTVRLGCVRRRAEAAPSRWAASSGGMADGGSWKGHG